MTEFLGVLALVAAGLVVYKMINKKETASEAVAEVAKEVETAAVANVAKVEEAAKTEATKVKARVKKVAIKTLDVNQDGKVDVADAVAAVKKVRKKKSA